MQVKVLFFGVLTEVAGTVIKHYSDVKTTKDLQLLIEEDFPAIVHYNYRIALNNELLTGDAKLGDGDEVAFMPPFAGG
jgi:molybdopterin synthase sulfur carrier subunit